MIVRHTRRPLHEAALTWGIPIDPAGIVPADATATALIDLGGRVIVLVLSRPDGGRDHRFLAPDGALLAADAAGFLALPRAGPGVLDRQASAVEGDAGDPDACVEDLHRLIEALAAAVAADPAHRPHVRIGPDGDARAARMHAAIDRLNAAPPGGPEHLPEMIGSAIVTAGGLETAHPDGGVLRLFFHVPMPGFRFAGFSPDPAEPLCALHVKNSRTVVGLLDMDTGEVYARRDPASVGFDAATLTQVRLWRRLLHPLLAGGAARARRVGIVFEHAHISHAIWNELAAVDEVLALGCAPAVYLFASCNEPILPVDAVFPEVVGHVRRGLTGPLPLLQATARGEAVFLPFRSYRVSRRLSGRLARLAREAEPALDARLAAAGRGATVVLIGLRLENRCWVRQREGYAALVRRLGRRRGERFLVLVDGHNTLPGGRYVESHCEEPTGGPGSIPPLVRMEMDLAAGLAGDVAEVRTVAVESLVPCSMAASLVASLRADLFVTHFGAGLAKYKWVANGRGCVLSSRAVLAGKDDLRIYDTPMFLEDAIPCAYYPAERVVDRDGSANAVRVPGGREREDFDLDPEEFARFVEAQLPGARRSGLGRWLRRLLPWR